MAETEATDGEASAGKRSVLPLLIALVLSLALGGGGFFAAYSGLLDSVLSGGGEGKQTDAPQKPGEMPEIAFVAVDPIIVSLGSGSEARHLRFQAQLEVASGQEAAVASLMPRILDVLHGYLRAVTAEDVERSSALLVLRAQMLRRVQLVVGEGRVNDLLVTEFVIN